jgi:hypothetical protein
LAKRGRQGDGGGRPKFVFTDDQIVQVEKLASVLSKKQMADYFGINENTFLAAEKRQPDVFQAYQKGRAQAITSVAGNLIQQAISGNVTAAIFYLKTQARWKELKDEPVKETDTVINVVLPDANKHKT